MDPVLKTGRQQCLVGSNPTPSAVPLLVEWPEAGRERPRRRRHRDHLDRYEAKCCDYASVSQKMNAGRLLAPRSPLGIVGWNLLFSTPTVFSPAMKAFGRVLRTFIV